jgi:hypothetical protein
MLRKASPLFFFVLLFFISCSNNANQYLIEDFEVSEAEISISLLTINIDEMYDRFPNHVYGALRPAEREIFDNHLHDLLSSQTRSFVNGQMSHTVLLDFDFEERFFNVRNNQLRMISPVRGTDLSNGTNESRFVIILDQFYFTSYQNQVGGDSYAGHEGEIETRVRFETKYMIWDNEMGDAIAWGRIDTNERLSMSNQASTYRTLIADAFNRIVRMSPFNAAV